MYLEFATSKNGQEYGLALYNLGYTYFKQKNYGNAGTWFTRFVDRGSINERTMQADAYNRIGDCNFYDRRFEQARQDYARAVEIDPSLGITLCIRRRLCVVCNVITMEKCRR